MTDDSEMARIALTRELIQMPGLRGSTEDRFWKFVTKKGLDDCWPWGGARSSRGYGRIQTPVSSSTPAHRVSYVLHNGTIAEGNVIDHVCRNRMCVNPRHLRQVSNKINVLENSASPTAINANKTTCKHGHSLSGRNLIIESRGRRCRECQRIQNLAHYYKKRGRLSDAPPEIRAYLQSKGGEA